MTEGVHILRGVRKETDGFRHFNKVTVVGGELSNFDNDPDSYTDTGDAASWEAAGGGSVTEDKNSIAFGACSLKFSWDQYLGSLICRYDFSASGKDLTPFKYMKFHHRTDSTGIQKNPPAAIWEFYGKLEDTGGVGASKVYIGWGSIQPPQNFTEVVLKLSDFSEGSGFDWTSVRYIEITCYSDQTLPGDGVKGNYWIDKVHLYARNVTRSTSASTDFKHVREYVYRDEKLIDPDFISQVSNALLNVLKNNENRYRVPLIGMAFIKVGHKVEVVSPSHGLNGWYYIVEVEHRITPETGYITEMTLDKPRLCLETLLAEAIERKIKLIERGGIA